MAEKAAVLAPFVITDSDGNITDGASPLTTGVWGDIWKYQVPQGTGIILQAGDQFSLYAADAGAECGTTDCFIKVEVRDPSEQDKTLILGPAIYVKLREFQNRNTISKLQLGKPIKVYPRQWIAISAKDTGAIVVANCYFSLMTSKVAVPL